MNKTCVIEKWKKIGDRYTSIYETMYSNLFIIRLKYVPQTDEDDNVLLEDLLQEQKIFLETINGMFLSNAKYEKAFLELRLINNPLNRIINIYLILNVLTKKEYPLNTAERKKIEEQLDRLMPEGYDFAFFDDGQQKLDSDENQSDDFHLLSVPDHNYVYEICKSLFTISIGSSAFGSSPELLPIEQTMMVEAEKFSHFLLPSHELLFPQGKMHMGYFYKALQNSPITVQVRFSITTEPIHESEKELAIHFQTILNNYYNSYHHNYNINYQACYNKYLNNDKLYNIKIQVFSSDEVSASIVANSLCAIFTHSNESDSASVHCRSISNIVKSEELKEFKQIIYQDYYDSLVLKWTKKVQKDEMLKFFFIRMPFLSSINETLSLFRIPYATHTGLPGIVSKVIKPFYQPNMKTVEPKVDNIGNKKIKLGYIITQSNNENKSESVEYSILVKDLTKHGLIVGATGSGKTNTTLNFIKQLIENNIDFCLIEPVKTEYADQIKKLYETHHIKTGKKLLKFDLKNPLLNGKPNPEFLRFNPFVGVKGISTRKHLAYIRSAIMAAFPIHGIASHILKDCLYDFFKASKLRVRQINIKNVRKLKDEKLLNSDQIKEFRKWKANGKKHNLPEEFYYFAKNFIDLTPVIGLKDKDFFDPTKAISFYKEFKSANTSNIIQRDRTMISFYNFITDYIDTQNWEKKFKEDIYGVLTRRILGLTKDLFGEIFCPELWLTGNNKDDEIRNNIEDILGKNSCVIELDELPENEEKALIMAFLLTYLYESRTQRKSDDENTPYHITIIEEAHRLLSNSARSGVSNEESAAQNSSGKTVSLFTDMLAEIRAKNEGIFIIEQSPSNLISDVIKNTNLKIMHRLTYKNDRDYLGYSMNMDERQSRFASTLDTGEALIFDGQLDNPLLVKMKPFNKSEAKERNQH